MLAGDRDEGWEIRGQPYAHVPMNGQMLCALSPRFPDKPWGKILGAFSLPQEAAAGWW